MKKILLILLGFILGLNVFCQHPLVHGGNGEQKPGVPPLQQPMSRHENLSDSARIALNVIKAFIKNDSIHFLEDEKLVQALEELVVFFENRPPDTLKQFLKEYPYGNMYTSSQTEETDSVKLIPEDLPADSLIQADVPQETATTVDSLRMRMEEVTSAIETSSSLNVLDTTPLILSMQQQSVNVMGMDTFGLEKLDTVQVADLSIDSVVKIDTLKMVLADSLQRAVGLLLREMEADSTEIWVKNLRNDSVHMWLNDEGRSFHRFWLKNDVNDSIGIWMENIDRNSFRMIMDEGVYIRPYSKKEQVSHIELGKSVDEKLKSMKEVKVTTPPWVLGAETSLQFSQGYLSNWVKGGESSISALMELEGSAKYTKGNSSWENTGEINLGVLQTEDYGLRKNEDQFKLSSIYNEKIVDKWSLSVQGSLTSQFFKGYDYDDDDTTVVSNFLAPGYLVFSLGMTYKPKKTFSLMISPITSKTTIVRDLKNVDPTTYGLEEGQRVMREVGGYVETSLTTKFSDDISMKNDLELFSSYTNKPQNIDIDWEASLSMKINLYMEAKISTYLIYDDDVDITLEKEVAGETVEYTTKKIQFKELISVGFSYTF